MSSNSLSGANQIVLKAGYTEGGQTEGEGVASGTISPGMHVNMTTAADTEGRQTFAPGATAVGGTAAGAAGGPVRVAKENSLVGLSVADTIASGDGFTFHECMPGDIVQVLVASGQTVLKGSPLQAISGGKWNVATISGVGEAMEASAGALGADTLVRMKCWQ